MLTIFTLKKVRNEKMHQGCGGGGKEVGEEETHQIPCALWNEVMAYSRSSVCLYITSNQENERLVHNN